MSELRSGQHLCVPKHWYLIGCNPKYYIYFPWQAYLVVSSILWPVAICSVTFVYIYYNVCACDFPLPHKGNGSEAVVMRRMASWCPKPKGWAELILSPLSQAGMPGTLRYKWSYNFSVLTMIVITICSLNTALLIAISCHLATGLRVACPI